MAEYKPEGFLQTYSGKLFVFDAPTPEMIDVYDIAHALGNICRYNGHCHTYFSVAEHSVLLAAEFQRRHPDHPTVARAFLLHDAAEAYLCDLPRPIKYAVTGYREAEAVIESMIYRKFEVPDPLPSIVKDWDHRICVDEKAQLMNYTNHKWGIDDFEPLGIKLQFWSPAEAASRFLIMFKALS